MYRCAACGNGRFSSKAKFDSGTGWPSFTDPMFAQAIQPTATPRYVDGAHRGVCEACGGHLGHVFEDGPGETGQRWCINSVALDFDRA